MKKLTIPKKRKDNIIKKFREKFESDAERMFSVPGRTELSGNHTDHQHGLVLAAAVDLDMVAAVRENGTNTIRVFSKGRRMVEVSLELLSPVPNERGTTAALIRGVAARFAQLGCAVKGFDAYVDSEIKVGSGLSSSAAFEVLMGTIINNLFFEGKATPIEVAKVGQYAENNFFGKPCGLMDQMACAVGGMLSMDFYLPEDPVVVPVDFDFGAHGYTLCLIDSGDSHEDLEDEFADITKEMLQVANRFEVDHLRDVPAEAFYDQLSYLMPRLDDRATLRALHFFHETERTRQQLEALRNDDMDTYLRLMKESSNSSWMYLQNVIVPGNISYQGVAVTLAMCQHLLQGRGGYRVHGGGFGGSVQALVPTEMVPEFSATMSKARANPGCCKAVKIRPQGAVEIPL